jgi:hypothetical protein
MPTEEHMADVNTRGAGRASNGSTLLLGLVLLIVVAVTVWLVMRGSRDEAHVDVNVPQVEAPEHVDVDVKSSGDSR